MIALRTPSLPFSCSIVSQAPVGRASNRAMRRFGRQPLEIVHHVPQVQLDLLAVLRCPVRLLRNRGHCLLLLIELSVYHRSAAAANGRASLVEPLKGDPYFTSTGSPN